MQTFLPYPNMITSLFSLDNKRLGKQRVEAKQCIDIIVYNKPSRYRNHPAVKMWKGYENALILYYNISLEVWKIKGFRNIKLKPIEIKGEIVLPWWFGLERFHSKHRSILLGKRYDFYSQYWKDKPAIKINNKWPYYWPIERKKDHGSKRTSDNS